jgi:hypothetical protein
MVNLSWGWMCIFRCLRLLGGIRRQLEGAVAEDAEDAVSQDAAKGIGQLAGTGLSVLRADAHLREALIAALAVG